MVRGPQIIAPGPQARGLATSDLVTDYHSTSMNYYWVLLWFKFVYTYLL